MEGKKMVLTRKIQLNIDSTDPELRRSVYEKLYKWQRMCCRAANYIFTHQYLQEQVKDLFYLTEHAKIKLSNVEKDADGILTTSRMNTTYQVLSAHFKGEMPMSILSNLNNTLVSLFQKEKADYSKGVRSIRNYKRDIPLPIAGTDLRQLKKTDKGDFSFELFGIPLRTYLGKDFYDKRALMEKLFLKEIRLCASSIKLEKKKMFLLAAFEYDKEKHALKQEVIAEASLSIETPIVVNIGKSRYCIGNKEEFLYRRIALQAARQRVQKAAAFNRSGKGRRRKLKSLENYKDAEGNYTDHKLHVYSRRLIDFCIKHKAATLLLTNYTDMEHIVQEDAFLLRNWSYGNLKDKIMYKASKAGIAVIAE